MSHDRDIMRVRSLEINILVYHTQCPAVVTNLYQTMTMTSHLFQDLEYLLNKQMNKQTNK